MAPTVMLLVLLISAVLECSYGNYLSILFSTHSRNLHFSWNGLRFYDCLCADDSKSCELQVTGEDRFMEVMSVNKEKKHSSETYLPKYICDLPDPDIEAKQRYIECTRMTIDSDQGNTSVRYHRHQINFTEVESCDTTCIDLIWTNTQDVRYFVGGNLPKPTETREECPVDITTMEIPSNEPTSSLSLSTSTVPSQDGKSRDGKDNSDTVVAVSAGLGSALAVTIALAAAVVILVWRKKTTQSHPKDIQQRAYDVPVKPPFDGENTRYTSIDETSSRRDSTASQNNVTNEDYNPYEDVDYTLASGDSSRIKYNSAETECIN